MRELRGRLVPGAFALLLVACGSPPEGPDPGGLVYDVPDPNPALYEFHDSASFVVHTDGLGPLEITTVQEGVAELLFGRSGGRFSVDVRFPVFRGSFRNPSQDASRVTERDIEGPLKVELRPRGQVEVVDTPSMSADLLDLAGPETLVRPFFVRLPGRAVTTGAQWVDTLVTVDRAGGTVSRARSIVTSTLLGDTVVADRRLLRIGIRAQSEIEVTGTSGGVEVEQRLTGWTEGRVLWDAQGRLLVERREEGEMVGSLSMAGAGVAGMPVEATVRRQVRLRE